MIDYCQSTKREVYWKRYYTAHCALHNHFKRYLPAFIRKKLEMMWKARVVRTAELATGHCTRLHTRVGAQGAATG